MMINEGIIASDTAVAMKSEMIRQLDLLEETTPKEWERAVFEALTGYRREDVDWEVPGSQAAYYMWIKSFDRLIGELIDDGYVHAIDKGRDRKALRKTEWDPSMDFSQLVYSSRTPS